MGNEFAPLMQSLYLAQQNFKESWKKQYVNLKKAEPSQVTETRKVFLTALDKLFIVLWKYEKDFLAGDSAAIDRILDFLEVDIPAHRCGYAKEKFYRRLKSFSLNANQTERIRRLAFKLCASGNYRREFRDLVRLMIKIADENFIEKIKELEAKSEGVVKFKAKLTLETILKNRMELL